MNPLENRVTMQQVLVGLAVVFFSIPAVRGNPPPVDVNDVHPYPASVGHGRQAQFLSGDFSEFSVWAAQWIGDDIESTWVHPPDTPHARFWSDLVQDSARREALLPFLHVARDQRLAQSDPQATPREVAPCKATCQNALVAYIDAFDDPRHMADQTCLMPESGWRQTHQPDAAIVALAGDLGLVAAIPGLTRCVRAERRFFLVETDHPTDPQEVGGLFDAALFALVEIARSHPERADEIRAELRTLHDQLQIPEGERVGLESYWLEVYDEDDYGEAEPPPQATHATRQHIERVTRDRSKVPRLAEVLALLEDVAGR